MTKEKIKLTLLGILPVTLHTFLLAASMLISYIPLLAIGAALRNISSLLGELTMALLALVLFAPITGLWYFCGRKLFQPKLSPRIAGCFFLLPMALVIFFNALPLDADLPDFLTGYTAAASELFVADNSTMDFSTETVATEELENGVPVFHTTVIFPPLVTLKHYLAPFLLLAALYAAFCLGYTRKPIRKLWLYLFGIYTFNYCTSRFLPQFGVSQWILTPLQLGIWIPCGWLIWKEINAPAPPSETPADTETATEPETESSAAASDGNP